MSTSIYTALTPEQKRGLVKVFLEEHAAIDARIRENIAAIITARAIEPRRGFIANELSYDIGRGIEISLEGRGRGTGVAIVRLNGTTVYHAAHSEEYKPGPWITALQTAADTLALGDDVALLKDITSDREEYWYEANCTPLTPAQLRAKELIEIEAAAILPTLPEYGAAGESW